GWDLWMLSMEGSRTAIPYRKTTDGEGSGNLSPDGKWICYSSGQSGIGQVYVQAFPNGSEAHRISLLESNGGRWGSTGREVMDVSSDGTVWSVPVSTTPSFKSGAPRKLFKPPEANVSFAWTTDMSRFLLFLPVQDVAPSTITVEMNWPAEVERLRR